MEHKIYTADIVSITDEEKNKTEVGIITSENGIITAVNNSGGQALEAGWAVGHRAPVGDLMIPTTVDS